MVSTFIAIDISSFIAQGPYWSPYAKGTSWPTLLLFLLIFKDHVQTFPFGNHKMEKNCIFLFLGRHINHNNEMTPFIEIPKSKI
jgi:hypothetical protein